jgi:DNA-binding response OmpR family regulator
MPDKVLLIDDEPRLVAALQIRLEAAGYQVHTAYSGEEGVAAARHCRPDAIVLDINMPGMDGCEVCRLIKADSELRATPVIVISAITTESAQQAAFWAGASEFLAKPYRAVDVIAKIREEIESQRFTGIAQKSQASSKLAAS